MRKRKIGVYIQVNIMNIVEEGGGGRDRIGRIV